MEFRRATLDEQPDPWLVERHEREIFPLLHRRALVRRGARLPAVRPRDRRAARSTRPSSPTRTGRGPSDRSSCTTTGLPRRAAAIRESAPYARKAAPTARSGSSGDRSPMGWACPTIQAAFVAFRRRADRPRIDPRRRARAPGARPATSALDAYGGNVFWEFREIRDGVAGQWARLAAPSRRAWRCRRSTTRCASSSSNPSTRRCARSSPAASSEPRWSAGRREAYPDELERRFRDVPRGGGDGDGRRGRSGIVAASSPAAALRPGRNRPTASSPRVQLAPAGPTVLLGWIALRADGRAGTRRDVGRHQSSLV